LEWRFVVESGEMCVLGRWRVCVYGGCVARLLGFLGKLVFDVSHVVVSLLWRFGIATYACSLILHFLTVNSEC